MRSADCARRMEDAASPASLREKTHVLRWAAVTSAGPVAPLARSVYPQAALSQKTSRQKSLRVLIPGPGQRADLAQPKTRLPSLALARVQTAAEMGRPQMAGAAVIPVRAEANNNRPFSRTNINLTPTNDWNLTQKWSCS